MVSFSTDRLVNDKGIDTVVSLHDIPGKTIETLERSGLDVYLFCYPEKELSTSEEIINFINSCVKPALEVIQEQLEKGQRVLVHSHTGRNRTCAIMACWVVKHHTTLMTSGAIQQVKMRRDEAFEKTGFEEAVRRYSDMPHSHTRHRELRLFLSYFRVGPDEQQERESHMDVFLSHKEILSTLYPDRTITSRHARPDWLDEWGIGYCVQPESSEEDQRTGRMLYVATVGETIVIYDEEQLFPFRSFLMDRYKDGDDISVRPDGKLVLNFSTIYRDHEAVELFLDHLREHSEGE